MKHLLIGTALTVMSLTLAGCGQEESQVQSPAVKDNAVVTSQAKDSENAVEHTTMKPVTPSPDAAAEAPSTDKVAKSPEPKTEEAKTEEAKTEEIKAEGSTADDEDSAKNQ